MTGEQPTLAVAPTHPRRLVYLGTPDMAVPPLQALHEAGFDIALVVTRIDKRRGRGSGTSPSPVKAAALELGLPVSHDLDEATSVGADLGVVVAYGRLIPVAVLARLAMVNIHFSLLPRWRGAAPVERALLAGDEITGVCLMEVAEGLDTGAVYARRELTIGDDDLATLQARLVDVGAELLVEELGRGLAPPTPQQGEPTHAAKLTTDDLRLDF
ncbi:MAG: methionyl-tRNA formyltransferase, partial [Actinomycetota bacterium]